MAEAVLYVMTSPDVDFYNFESELPLANSQLRIISENLLYRQFHYECHFFADTKMLMVKLPEL